MIKKEIKKCNKCVGYGFWPTGDLSPLGPIDAGEWGNKSIQCPWCSAGFVKIGERYNTLKNVKENEKNAK